VRAPGLRTSLLLAVDLYLTFSRVYLSPGEGTQGGAYRGSEFGVGQGWFGRVGIRGRTGWVWQGRNSGSDRVGLTGSEFGVPEGQNSGFSKTQKTGFSGVGSEMVGNPEKVEKVEKVEK
jgi:hypothetical protein